MVVYTARPWKLGYAPHEKSRFSDARSIYCSKNSSKKGCNMKPACRIEMFGGMRLQRSGQALPRLTTRKTEVLLAYLAFYPRRAHSREVLAEMLWPDEESTTVRNR